MVLDGLHQLGVARHGVADPVGRHDRAVVVHRVVAAPVLQQQGQIEHPLVEHLGEPEAAQHRQHVTHPQHMPAVVDVVADAGIDVLGAGDGDDQLALVVLLDQVGVRVELEDVREHAVLVLPGQGRGEGRVGGDGPAQRDRELGLDGDADLEVAGPVGADDLPRAAQDVVAHALADPLAPEGADHVVGRPVEPVVLEQALEERRVARDHVRVAGAELPHRVDDLVSVGPAGLDRRDPGQRGGHVHPRGPRPEGEGVDDEHRAVLAGVAQEADAQDLARRPPLHRAPHPAGRGAGRARGLVDDHSATREPPAHAPLRDGVPGDVAALVRLGQGREGTREGAGRDAPLGQEGPVGRHPADGAGDRALGAAAAEPPAQPLEPGREQQGVGRREPPEEVDEHLLAPPEQPHHATAVVSRPSSIASSVRRQARGGGSPVP